MEKDFSFKRRPSGSRESNEPKVIGRVLIEYLHSNEPLAVAFRKWKARDKDTKTKEGDEPDRLFRDIFPDTFIAINLKMFRRKRGRVPVGTHLNGVLMHDGEDHFSFIENATKKERVVNRRNPQVYKGTCINVNQQPDGSLYPSLNRPCYSEDYTFKHFCLRAAEELLFVAGLGEK